MSAVTAHRFKWNKRTANDGGTSTRNNKRRSDEALQALAEYQRLVGDEPEPLQDYHLSDLIADLGHACDRYHFDFEKVLRMAQTHWEEER